MKNLIRSTVASAASLALAASASAQDRLTRIRTPEPARIGKDTRGDGAVRAVVHSFANCTVERGPSRVRQYLETGRPTLGQLTSEDCLEAGDLRMPAPIMRAELAAALYRLRFKRMPADIRAVAAMTYAEAGDRVPYLLFGDCIVRAAPASADSLARATPGSVGEKGAVEALAPALRACLDEGQKAEFSPGMIRSFVFEPLYRLSDRAENPGTN